MATTYPKLLPNTPHAILTRLVTYLRYEKLIYEFGIEQDASELYGVGNWSGSTFYSDLMCKSQGGIWEFEIKKNYEDMVRDFKKQAWSNGRVGWVNKHDLIGRGKGPSKFWFVIPDNKKLQEKAKIFLKEYHPRYGLISVSNYGCISIRRALALRPPMETKHLYESGFSDSTVWLCRRLQKCEDMIFSQTCGQSQHERSL